MISLLNSFNVPYLDYITIFPDSMLPTKFYYFRSRPKLANDSKSGLPMIDYKLIQHSSEGKKEDRDIDTQFGYLTMTVDLGLTSEEETQIRSAVYKMLNDEDYRENMRILYPDAFTYLTDENNKDKISEEAIQLSSMGVVKDGVAKLEIWEGFGKGIKRDSSHEEKTASSGDYATPFFASFDKWGSELVGRALKVSTEVDKENDSIQTTATVRYELQVPFHVPAMQASVHVDTQAFYHYLTDLFSDENSLNGTYNGNLNTGKDGVADNFQHAVHVRGEILLSDEDIQDLLTKYNDVTKNGIVQIRDYSALTGINETDLKSEIFKSVLGIITNQIIPCMFEPTPVPSKTSTESSGSVYADKDPDEVARMIHYTFKDGEDITDIKNINYDFTMQSLVVMPMCAASTLLAVVPKDYVDKVVTLIDLESTEFNDHEVNITCPADFGANKISSIELNVKYDEPDVRFPEKQEIKDDFVFTTGKETYSFSFFESKDKNGKFLPEFKYQTKVSYIGKGHIEQNDGWSEWMKTSAHNLLIKPETTGFISVECEMGDIDWDLIKKVEVKFTYPPAQGKMGWEETLRFTKEGEKTKNWNCYRYGSQSDEYTYQVTYEDKNTGPYSSPVKKSTELHLCIDDLYEGPALEAEFAVNFSDTIVDKLYVIVEYDGKTESHLMTNSGTWTWSKQIRQGAPETYRYMYSVIYKDTTQNDTDWSSPCGRGTRIPIYTVEMKPLAATSASIQVSAQLLALWDKFYFVNVFVTYDDPANGIHYVEPLFALNKENPTKTVKVDCPVNSAKPFKISAEIYDLEGNIHPVEEKEYSRSCMFQKPQV